MLILGIDPGIALTGWGLVKKQDKPKLIKYGCIKTSPETPSDQRLLRIYQGLENIIIKYQPETICLEKLFFNTNVKTVMAVGEARGVVKICAVLHHLPLVEFTPLQIKTCITGYGRADKRQMQEMVRSLLSLDKIPKPDDAADAIAAALTYCFYNIKLEK